MHRFTLAIAVTAALMISGPAYAQKGHGGGKPTTGPSTTHGSSSTTHGNSGATTHGNSGASTHGQSGSHAPKTTTGGKTQASSATHGKSGDTHGKGSKVTTPSTTTGGSNTTSGSTTTSGSNATSGSNTTSNTTLTPVQQKLQKNTNLADKLRMRLPEGTDLMTAAEGFRNLGQFVAAVNVANNHEGVTFTQLKTRMVDEGMSLGQALQDVKKLSSANVQTEVQRAETEANQMIKSSTTSNTTTTTNTTNTTTSTTTKKKKTGSTENK